ncbi:phospholipid-transporting ATPase ABCA3-like isoform X5 [Sitodiplosis mosellana]|nr:phospholipid-transporting ATPase ABCA3-like isoform X5 [Sitodiplosis mosellana]XP_055298017.1 phospholipid-transporting ATPase ABCA3-like isoform X5 [Sitodiplosis mosellana]XP_055298018.1 phospholipid-transporting ATPase ABCA3-like isoform X5 [Sitodiplosis mosellana]XP_055298019.1 phospholipid-transporting ATPase ABCA3-like isoform X5 [Sitodiplosis mosellana]XP_055298020.1 phospholipid-transporting ATPase ABCA3-like isoform X5 [Sitodiplosis mosellana]
MGTNAAPPMYEDRKMANNFDKFRLLMWKNFLLQYRHKIQTAAEIMVPVLFSVILILIRSIVDPDIYPNNTIYNSFDISDLRPLRNGSNYSFEFKFLLSEEDVDRFDLHVKEWALVYSPVNKELAELMNETARLLKLENGTVAVNTRAEIESVMFNRELVAGLEFDLPANDSNLPLPKKLSYKLRFPSESRTPRVAEPLIFNWHTNLLYPLFSTGGPRTKDEDYGGMPFYYQEGFLPVQDAIARSFKKLKCSDATCENTTLPKIRMQRYPYPPYIFDVLLQGLETIVSFFILLSFIYPTINTVRFIAIEKERQLKEAMKIMGLPSWLHWTSWFVRTMVFMVVSISFIVALLKVPVFDSSVAVFTHSDWTAIWVFLFVYSISMTTFCFMLSVFFSKANTAAAVAGLVWFILYVPFSFTQQNYVQLSLRSKLIACISSNTAMAYGFQLILRFEGTGEGLQWSNFWRPVSVDDSLTVGITMCFMLGTSLIYLLITLYVEKVLPGNYGVPEKWYFPFTAKFWFGTPEFSGVEDSSESSNESNPDFIRLNFEPDPKHRHAGVKVKNLRKVYSNRKVACKGLTLNMFDDQITVLLGHNGAGKTTTMSMLTGMFPPTSGTAIINGHDIRTNIQKARSSLGYCPQHNILFDELTVREHIEFYGRLKGLSQADVQDEVTKYVQLLELEPKIDAMSASLSGGMQRKLSVGVALCGRSRVVFCDEPTSGMDPAARRALWDLLQNEKKGRTILLTTHFMDEADVLGDRIAIMAESELKCCGTSFFLKKRFGTGYRLVCVKNGDCNANAVTNLLREYIPGIEVQEDIASELAYALPDEYVDKFERMFEKLENNQTDLKLGSFGVSLTTLEEVFLKVGADSNLDKMPNGNPLQNGEMNGNYKINRDSDSAITNIELSNEIVPTMRGLGLRVNQWMAMFKKRYNCWIRSWVLFFLQNLIPVVFIVISVFVVHMMAENNTLPNLEITLNRYEKTVTMLQMPTEFDDPQLQRIFEKYRTYIQNQGEDNRLDEFNEDIQEHFLKLAKSILVRLNSQYLAGMSINNNSDIIGWFNNQPFHTTALSINLIHNAMIKTTLGDDYSIEVTNSPLPFRVESTMSMLMSGQNMGFQLASNISFAMAFVSSFYLMFYIKERVSKAKLLQFVSGLNVSTFWITSFIFDFATYILTALMIILTLAVFQEDGWATISELTPAFLSLILFGFSMLPMTFVSSLLFSIPSTGFVRMTIFFIFTGITVFFVILAMSFPAFNLANTANMLKWFFLVFPHYSLSSILNNLNQMRTMDRICEQRCNSFPICNRKILCALVKECCATNTYDWKEPGISRNLTYMAVTGIFFFILLLIIEYRVFAGLIYWIRSLFARKLPPIAEDDQIDDDVNKEKQIVNGMNVNDIEANSLVLKSLSKFYGKFLAVNQISIAIKRAECFGLLGVNGAGKTSTFKMLTGDTKISSGEAYARGISLKSNMPEVHKIIGYCPQFDALIEDLTGAETLELFALLRGIHPSQIPALTQQLATELNFMKHINKRVEEYSGGNKRKLSTAVALIGNPVLVYLDEPTTGMDPGAKRNLWNMVSKVRSTGKSIILTSHSMEECEALCTRLAIMVNGEFKCLGSTQHLKSKFSKGFLLTIKVQKNTEIDKSFEDVLGELIKYRSVAGSIDSRAADIQMSDQLHLKVIRIKEFVQRNFIGADLKEEYLGLLTYYVPPNNKLRWSSMFGLMETAKQTLHIEDYSISQTSLEQVFLSFTKFQRDETQNNRSANNR